MTKYFPVVFERGSRVEVGRGSKEEGQEVVDV